jgi:hypothetical protein
MLLVAVMPLIIFGIIVGLWGTYWAKREREEWRQRNRR